MNRRTLLATGAGALLVACGAPPAPPAVLAVTASATPGANPGPDGRGRPLTLTVLQLRGTGAFEGADVFALQDPGRAVGADLVSAAQVALAPGGSGSSSAPLDPATTAIGLVGGYREPAGKVFRLTVPVTPGQGLALSVTAGPAGLSLG